MRFFFALLSVTITCVMIGGLSYSFVVFLRTKELPSRFLHWGLFVSVVLLLVRGAVHSVVQYYAFQKGLLRFLSPSDLFSYTVRYSLLHYFSTIALSACIAGFLLVVFWVLQKRSHGRWLDTNERILVAFGALAAGWPGAILYAMGVFFLPLLATPWLARNMHERRVRLAPFIILSALLAMAVAPFILPYTPWLQVLVCQTCI